MSENVIVWVHGDSLSPTNAALEAYPGAPAIFVWDDALLDEWQIGLKRIVFMYECLLEMPVSIHRGDVVAEVVAFAQKHGAAHVVTTPSPSPRFRSLRQQIERAFPVDIIEPEPFLDYDGKLDLKRFSRYWSVAQRHVFR